MALVVREAEGREASRRAGRREKEKNRRCCTCHLMNHGREEEEGRGGERGLEHHDLVVHVSLSLVLFSC